MMNITTTKASTASATTTTGGGCGCTTKRADSSIPSSITLSSSYTKWPCIIIGIFVGMFIQLSSLCTNTIYFNNIIQTPVVVVSTTSITTAAAAIGSEDIVTNDSSTSIEEQVPINRGLQLPIVTNTTKWYVTLYPIVWSIITIAFGIVLLLLLRSIIKLLFQHYYMYYPNVDNATTTSNNSKHNYYYCSYYKKLDVLLRTYEQSIATGTLWGISIVWIFTDAILGRYIQQQKQNLIVAKEFDIDNDISNSNVTILDDEYSTSSALLSMNNYHGNYISYWYLPILISSVALLGWHIIVAIVNRPTNNRKSCNNDHMTSSYDLHTPLLPQNESENIIEFNTQQQDHKRHYCSGKRMIPMLRFLSFMIGTLIGIFIQSSTLGATYMGRFIHTNQSSDSNTTTMTSDDIPVDISRYGMFSIIVSFITSCFGIALLLCIRAFIICIIVQCQHETGSVQKPQHYCVIPQCTDSTTTSTTTSHVNETNDEMNQCSRSRSAICPLKDFVLINIEQFLVTGTVLGVNVAWMVSDYFVLFASSSLNDNYQEHQYNWWIQSILTMILSTLWCPLLLYCAGYNKHYKEENSSSDTKIINDTTDHTIITVQGNQFTTTTNADNVVAQPQFTTTTSTEAIQYYTATRQHQRQSRIPYNDSGLVTDEELGYM